MKVFVVIPAFNEEQVIGRVIEEVKKIVNEVIVVDDGSKDQTSILARQAGARVVRHRLNRGQGAALQTGILSALGLGAEVIVTFDADGQHLASEINQIIKPIISGEAEVTLGSRFLLPSSLSNIPLSKKVILKLATWLTEFYTGLSITDTHNGFRAFSRTAAKNIIIRQDGMAHASEIIEQIKKHNLKFKEVAVTIKYTDYSKQKGQRLTNSFKIAWDLFFRRVIR